MDENETKWPFRKLEMINRADWKHVIYSASLRE